MRIFLACLGTETNTFSPIPTGMAAFEETMLCHGNGSTNGRHIIVEPIRAWRDKALAEGHEVIESLSAFAEPGGLTTRSTHRMLRDEILADLLKAGPVDLILLSLHGAMAADGCLDVEGDLLQGIRTIIGDEVTIGVELDLHCQVTEAMTSNATIIVTYKEYPHVDILERASELYKIAIATVTGGISPTIIHRRCDINAYLPTTREPMRSFVKCLTSHEGRDGVLSVSLAHGFPHGDGPGLGAGVLVVTDRNSNAAEAIADELVQKLWDVRDSLRPEYLSIDEALDQALASPRGPIVIADASDNAGCGAASDATFFLRRMLERDITDAIIAVFWDPIAVRLCVEAGEGTTFALRVGGKCGPLSGDPIDIRATVMRIQDDAWQTFNGFKVGMGTVVWLRFQGIDILIGDKRFQVGSPDLMTNVGLDPFQRKIIVVKSTQHFHAGFAPIAARVIYTAGPGTSNPDTSRIHYVNVERPGWPAEATALDSSVLVGASRPPTFN